LGGTSYAVSQIDGKDLRDRSVPGRKLKLSAVTGKELDLKHVVVPRAKLADATRKLFVTHSRKHRRLAAAAAASAGTQSLEGLADGDTATLFASPPFTVSAHCANNTVKVYATSSEPGWWGPG